jgi:hypothetical protein
LALLLAVAATVTALIRGGSLENLASTPVRGVGVLLVGAFFQIGFRLWEPDWLTEAGALLITLGSMILVAFFLTLNRKIVGTSMAAFGLLLNVFVIGANGAMPVSARAVELAGLDPAELDEPGLKHERLTDGTRFGWLGDVIPVPRVGFVVSVGDLVLAAGMARAAYTRTRYKEGRKPSAVKHKGKGPGAPVARS